eukprot:TRINITY_DN54033_c0_g1_i1.p1 TRINITY_DN54033_c0_g1~~TRINITY_DN54033_c0_g1_i1.p1  ORF type:complete len:160 (-),score=27.22 TRINITY_DN54033_c0_g1_i1:486-965(-)
MEENIWPQPPRATKLDQKRQRWIWLYAFAAVMSFWLLASLERDRGFLGPSSSMQHPASWRTSRRAEGSSKEGPVSASRPPAEGSVSARRAGQRNSKLLAEITGNTPGLARSSAADETEGSESSGGVMFFVAPRPRQRVDFALWFGPLPCFQVGTFRMCL